MKLKVQDNRTGEIRYFDSSDTSIAILFTSDDELDAVQRLDGRKSRAVGSFPAYITQGDAMLFLNEWPDGMTFKIRANVGAALSSIELPQPPLLGRKG